jgi:hypothetical protein
MQKRMRQLDQSSDDPMFACFAQMRYGKDLSSQASTYSLS